MLLVSKIRHPKIAKENIECFVVLKENTLSLPLLDESCYKIGENIDSNFQELLDVRHGIEGYECNSNMYSFKTCFCASSYKNVWCNKPIDGYRVYHCTIPKGAKYFECFNKDLATEMYCSNILIINKVFL